MSLLVNEAQLGLEAVRHENTYTSAYAFRARRRRRIRPDWSCRARVPAATGPTRGPGCRGTVVCEGTTFLLGEKSISPNGGNVNIRQFNNALKKIIWHACFLVNEETTTKYSGH